MIVEHPPLRAECRENHVDVDRGGACDEGKIAGDARVVHGKDIEPTESLEAWQQEVRQLERAEQVRREGNLDALTWFMAIPDSCRRSRCWRGGLCQPGRSKLKPDALRSDFCEGVAVSIIEEQGAALEVEVERVHLKASVLDSRFQPRELEQVRQR